MLTKKLKVTDKEVISGKGMIAAELIESGELIWQPGSKIVSIEQLDKIQGKFRAIFYFSQIDEDLFAQNIEQERAMNHSCNPNSVLMERNIVALRTIHPGEEITYDYGLTETYPPWRIRCRCGYRDCREVVSNEDYKDTRLVRERGANIADYVLRAASRVNWYSRYRYLLKRAAWRYRFALFGDRPLHGVWRFAALILKQSGFLR